MSDPISRSYLLCGAEVLTPGGWESFDLNVLDGVIADGTGQVGQLMDLRGLRLVPGFIDLQINGGWGHEFEKEPTSMWLVAKRLVEYGVTTFLPTLTSNGYFRRRQALSAWSQGPGDGDRHVGAEPLGWHLEGPWLAPSRHGAHSRELLEPIPDRLPADMAPELGVRLVTLAPELTGAPALISALVERGVVVSCGHSEATVEQAQIGFDAGVTMGTHLFNAMSGLHHRTPGLAAALLLDPEIQLGIIADGAHVAPDMIRLAAKMGGDRLITVSDGVGEMGMTRDGAPRRLLDGTLAGASAGLDAGLRNLMAWTGWDLAQAVTTVTEHPARLLSLHDRGRIEVGRRADLVALDEHGQVRMTFVRGALAWDLR